MREVGGGFLKCGNAREIELECVNLPQNAGGLATMIHFKIFDLFGGQNMRKVPFLRPFRILSKVVVSCKVLSIDDENKYFETNMLPYCVLANFSIETPTFPYTYSKNQSLTQ